MAINDKKNFFKRGKPVEASVKPTPPELSQQLYAVSKFTARPPLREKKVKTKLTTEEKADMRKKKKQQLKQLKQGRGLSRPKYIQVEDSKAGEGNSLADTTKTPPYTMKINNKNNSIEVRVTLHKVPPDLITVDCSSTKFHLDTLKWSSKFMVNTEYIYDIEVDPGTSTAEYKHGSLVVTLPITKFTEQAKAAQKKLNSAKREERQIRFVQGRNTELIGIRYKPKKPKSSPLNASQQVIDNVVRSSNKKRKTFLEDKSKALELVEQAATEEEQKVATKQVQMGRISQFMQARLEIMQERKKRKQVASETSTKKAQEAKKQKLNEVWGSVPVPMSSGHTADKSNRPRVSFAATPEVAVYQSNDDPKASKKKQKEKISFQYER